MNSLSKFKFIPEPNFSSDSGYNQGERHSFDEKLDSVLREYFQNSRDAFYGSNNFKKDKFIFRFYIDEIDLSFYDFENLLEYNQHCLRKERKASLAYNELQNNIAFLKKYKNKKNSVPCLIIEDNGPGLSGESWLDDDSKVNAFVGSNISNKSETSGGSFGVGKQTAFTIGIDTILFFSHFHETDYKMGMGVSRLRTITKNEKRLGPHIYFGKKSEKNINESNISVADCVDMGDEISEFRNIDESGLSVVVPTDYDIKDKYWVDMVTHSLLNSYFYFLETESNYSITIENRLIGIKNIITRKNLDETIHQLEKSKWYQDEEDSNKKNDKKRYDFILFKNFILKENMINSKREFSHPIDYVSKKCNYNGRIHIGIFRDEELNQYNLNSGKNFRFSRNGLTLREEKYPTSSIGPNDFCGYMYFSRKDDEPGKSFEKLFRDIEAPNHDKLSTHLLKTIKGVSESGFKREIKKFNKYINDAVNKELDMSDEDEFEIEIDELLQSDDNDAERSKNNYKRKLTIFENKQKKTVTQGKAPIVEIDESGESLTPDDDGDIFIEQDQPIDGSGKGKGGGGGSKRRHSPANELSFIKYKSKFEIISDHKKVYIIRLKNLNNIEDKFNITLKSRSDIRSITSFKIDKLEIGIKSDKINEVKDYTNNISSKNTIDGQNYSYHIPDVDCSKFETAFIYMEVTESKNIYSEFNLVFNKI
jgi:hypothetical protein